ncbi:protein lifeguard 1-like [Scleropages formosus]|uniref:Protein lifeguard 1-like n=1 Tax=Scleropages formosus TaxID=113540 RepID=A0A0P7VGP4_SCLFO|nr:protein lifeguard 1-like [Scleropages formosus]
MDPRKTPSAPPSDWNQDNNLGLVYPPPPYQDQPQYPNQGGYYPAPQYHGGAPQDYLGYSIFTMLCCCLPLGIAALVYSISTRTANNHGQLEMAKTNSRLARNLNHAGLASDKQLQLINSSTIIMDSSKISGVPPPDWNPDSKAGMAYPPPPYQDQPQYPNQGGYYPAPQYHGGAPQDYLGYSIFTMLCCCLPLGIAALIYSISPHLNIFHSVCCWTGHISKLPLPFQTRDANNQGHLEMAKRNSRLARNLNHAGLGIGIAIFVLWIIFVLFLSAK